MLCFFEMEAWWEKVRNHFLDYLFLMKWEKTSFLNFSRKFLFSFASLGLSASHSKIRRAYKCNIKTRQVTNFNETQKLNSWYNLRTPGKSLNWHKFKAKITPKILEISVLYTHPVPSVRYFFVFTWRACCGVWNTGDLPITVKYRMNARQAANTV